MTFTDQRRSWRYSGPLYFAALLAAFGLVDRSVVVAWADPPAEEKEGSNEESLQEEAPGDKTWRGEYPELDLEVISEREFEAAWQFDFVVDDQPLGEVLEQLVQNEEGWKVGIMPHPALEQKISLDLKKVGTLEAIEEACRAADVHPLYRTYSDLNKIRGLLAGKRRYRSTGPTEIQKKRDARYQTVVEQGLEATIELESGKYPAIEGVNVANQEIPSVVFAGPVRVRIEAIYEDAPHSSGKLELGYTWLPGPGDIFPTEKDQHARFPILVTSIRGFDGQNLMGHGSSWSGGAIETKLAHQTRNLPIKNLLRDVEGIEMIAGELLVSIPRSWATAWFENPQKKQTVKEDSFHVSTQWRPPAGQEFYFSLEIPWERGRGNSLDRLSAFAFDADGKLIGAEHTLGGGGGTSGMGSSIKIQQPPALVAIAAMFDADAVRYPFRFYDIPLSRYQEQPEKLTKLDYGDHPTPITIESEGLVPKKRGIVRLKIHNHSNKDIQEYRATIYIVDTKGKPVKGKTASIMSGGYLSTLDEKPKYAYVLDAGKSKTSEQRIYNFTPRQEDKMQVEVREVIFSDGTKWNNDTSVLNGRYFIPEGLLLEDD